MSVSGSAQVVTNGFPVNRSEQGQLPGNVRGADQPVFDNRSESDCCVISSTNPPLEMPAVRELLSGRGCSSRKVWQARLWRGLHSAA